MGKMELSPEERKRRSDAAKKAHAEGKLGGKQEGAGRPSGRAQAYVAEQVRKDAPDIVKALRAALKADSATTRLKAAVAMLSIEKDEEEHKAKAEQRKYDRLTKEQLLELAREKVNLLKERGIDFDVEGTATEIIDQKQLDA